MGHSRCETNSLAITYQVRYYLSHEVSDSQSRAYLLLPSVPRSGDKQAEGGNVAR